MDSKGTTSIESLERQTPPLLACSYNVGIARKMRGRLNWTRIRHLPPASSQIYLGPSSQHPPLPPQHVMDRIGAGAHLYALAIVSTFCHIVPDCLQWAGKKVARRDRTLPGWGLRGCKERAQEEQPIGSTKEQKFQSSCKKNLRSWDCCLWFRFLLLSESIMDPIFMESRTTQNSLKTNKTLWKCTNWTGRIEFL